MKNPCPVANQWFPIPIAEMFRSEWGCSKRDAPLRTVAIADTKPKERYLYPEVLFSQRLFAKNGIQAVIADPTDFAFRDSTQWFGEQKIDLVHNRLTDFTLEADDSRVLHGCGRNHAPTRRPMFAQLGRAAATFRTVWQCPWCRSRWRGNIDKVAILCFKRHCSKRNRSTSSILRLDEPSLAYLPAITVELPR